MSKFGKILIILVAVIVVSFAMRVAYFKIMGISADELVEHSKEQARQAVQEALKKADEAVEKSLKQVSEDTKKSLEQADKKLEEKLGKGQNLN